MNQEYSACRGPDHDGTSLFGVSQVHDCLGVPKGDGQHSARTWNKIPASTPVLFLISIEITSPHSEIVV